MKKETKVDMIMGAKVKERDLKMLTVLSLKMKDMGPESGKAGTF